MIPVNEPLIGEKELEYVNECLKTGWISSSGHFINKFEEKWAEYCGMKHGVAVSNGSVALQVAINCLDLKPGDKILMPTFTIVSCALAVIYNKCIPVLVDCDPETWCIDIDQTREILQKNFEQESGSIKAIMPVHIYGHPVDMDPIIELATKYGLYIIEDAAEVHGAEYLTKINKKTTEWKRCGGFGHISTFSFYANKIITTGEGGMVLTNDESFAEKARSLRNLCFRPERRFFHTDFGNNFRLTNVQAAIGLAQLERIQEIINKKIAIGKTYTSFLSDIDFITLQPEKSWAKHVYWMFALVVSEESGFDAMTLAKALRKADIETRPFFLGMHSQPIFNSMNLFKNEKYPVADFISKQGLYLPSGLTLRESDIIEICTKFKQVIKNGK